MNEEPSELQRRYERLSLLYQVAKVIHSTLEPQEALQLILREAVRLVRASSGSVALLNPTSGFLEIHASHALPETAATLKLRLGEGVTGWVVRYGRSARVSDVLEDKRYVSVRPGVRSELAVPLELEGEVRGVLNVDSDRGDAFSGEDQELLEALAEHAAAAIRQTWRYEQLRLKANLFESLVSVSQAVNSSLTLDDVLRVITREACVLMRAKMCSLMLLDPSREWLDLHASHGAGEAYMSKPRLTVEDSFLGVVVRRKKPLQLENVQTSTRYQNVELARKEGLVSLLSVPLVYQNQVIGTLSVYTGAPYSFSNEEIRILSALAELSAIAIEKARLYERLVDAEELLRQNEKLSALGLLAAEVAHEIRNPLTVMKMLYHSLDLRFPSDDPRNKDAQIIARKIDHLNRFVDRILALSRTNQPTLAPVQLNKIIEELLLLVRHKLKNQQIELEQHLDPALPTLTGDAGQLEQAFLNLVLNAADAMPNGGTLTITTHARPNRDDQTRLGSVQVEFLDTGQGMNPEQRRKASNPVLRSTKPKGAGLGLAIVSRIVETHRGRLEIKSRPGKGTSVTLELPAE